MKLSRVLVIGLVGGALTLTTASYASAAEAYSTLRCSPLATAANGSFLLGSPPPWSEMVYNWASQLYNPSASLEVFRCSIDENSAAPVSSVTVTGWSTGCNPGNGTPQLTAWACKVPKGGGVGATCNSGEPLIGGGPTLDCTAGTKNFNISLPSHVAGDALELRVFMDVPLNNSTAAFWAYSAQ